MPGKKIQGISLIPDVIGFQALLNHLQIHHLSKLLNPEAAKIIAYVKKLFLAALIRDPVSCF